MPMSGKEVVRLLLANGWQLDRINGSHYIMKPGLLNAILKQAGLK